MRAYVAARMENQRDASEIRDTLRRHDIEVVAKWIDERPANRDDSIEDKRRRLHMDLSDVADSDVLVLFKPQDTHRSTTGGHHVEFGWALALGKPAFLVGTRENLFHWHENVVECDTVDAAAQAILSMRPDDIKPNPRSIDSYQQWTLKPAKYPDAGKGTGRAIAYAITGLGGETGELIEKVLGYLRGEFIALGGDSGADAVGLGQIIGALSQVATACEKLEDLKREIREGRMKLPDMRPFPEDLLTPVKKELGDVAWYTARVPNELGMSCSEVLRANVEKLEGRIVKNTLHGRGDER